MNTAPHAPGALGVAPTASEMLDYLGRLDAWLSERRQELDALDAQVLATKRQAELNADMALAMALWQAAKTRQNLLLATWDSGRVSSQELERLSALIWGRLDTQSAQVASLQSMAVSLPEAGRLSDALVSQLRTRLNTNPAATALQLRLTGLRAQAERIREQLGYEPPALAPVGQAKLASITSRIAEVTEKQSRGGDITGLLSVLEVDAAKLERDLIVGAAQRRQGRDLLTKVREEHVALAAQERAVTALADQVRAAVWPVGDDRLPHLDELGPIPNTVEALTGYAQRLTDLSQALSQAQARLDRRLAEVNQAGAQLAALQLKASGLGDQPTVTELIALISSRLATGPVALPVVQQLLAALAAEIDFRNTQGTR